jgi:RNA polymerase sigma-70 factor (ECF subfamily)
MALWRRAHQFDAASGSLAGWLLGIARHRAIDRHRAEIAAAHRQRPFRLPTRSVAQSRPISTCRPLPPSTDRRRRAALAAIDRPYTRRRPTCTDGERDVLLLAYGRGLSQAGAAERTGTPLGTVKSRTSRAGPHRVRIEACPTSSTRLAR